MLIPALIFSQESKIINVDPDGWGGVINIDPGNSLDLLLDSVQNWIWVSKDNQTGTETGTMIYPYNTIQEGLDAASDGDAYADTPINLTGVGVGAAHTLKRKLGLKDISSGGLDFEEDVTDASQASPRDHTFTLTDVGAWDIWVNVIIDGDPTDQAMLHAQVFYYNDNSADITVATDIGVNAVAGIVTALAITGVTALGVVTVRATWSPGSLDSRWIVKAKRMNWTI